MDLYEEIFNKQRIYDMFFFNIKAVLEYPTLEILEKENPAMYACWVDITTNQILSLSIDEISNCNIDNTNINCYVYRKHAIKYPEFIKIVAITYAKPYHDNEGFKRHFYKIVDNDEVKVIEQFIEVLDKISFECATAKPFNGFDPLCGYNITAFDIPLLIKRFFLKRDSFQKKELPLILKKLLTSKPWDGAILDVVNVWKFNSGQTVASLQLISEFLGLKKTVNLLSNSELSEMYWNNIESEPEKTLEDVAMQSLTQTNLVLQLMRDLRTL